MAIAHRKNYLFAALTLVLVLAISIAAGCNTNSAVEEKPVLSVAFIPAEDIEGMFKAFGAAKKYLEKEVGVEIEMYKATDYTAVVEAMRADKVDMAFFGPFSYILAAERANAKAIVGGGTDEGKLGTYHSILVTHKDSGLKNIDDVKARVNSLSISFVDPASTSGHLIPRGFMESVGISVDNDYKEIVFAGGHDASILAVHARKVDLGATWEGPYERAIEGGLIKPDDVLVIWKSDGIPSSPIAVRDKLDPDIANKLQQAFLDMPQKDPEAMRQLEEAWEKNKTYVKVSDEDYEFIRQVAKGLGQI